MPLGTLLQLPQFRSFSAEDVQRVVDTSGKQRFALKPGDPSIGPLIRANQGHSLQVGLRRQMGEPGGNPACEGGLTAGSPTRARYLIWS